MKLTALIASALFTVSMFAACSDLDSGMAPRTFNHGGAGTAGELPSSGSSVDYMAGSDIQAIASSADSLSTMPAEILDDGPMDETGDE
jgi:hypothetical protein